MTENNNVNNAKDNNGQGQDQGKITDSLRAPLESLKTAGASAVDVAKNFGENFKEEREAKKDGQAAEATQSEDSSLLNKVTNIAKSYGGTVLSAAESTRSSEAFSEAKEKISEALSETKDGVSEAVSTAKERREASKEAKDSSSSNGPDIIEGEVISTDD